jgi:hypothetical protein
MPFQNPSVHACRNSTESNSLPTRSPSRIPLAPLGEQRRVAVLLRDQMATVERARKAAGGELATINALPAALLRRAFAGEL